MIVRAFYLWGICSCLLNLCASGFSIIQPLSFGHHRITTTTTSSCLAAARAEATPESVAQSMEEVQPVKKDVVEEESDETKVHNDEQQFLQRCKVLCEARNLPLEKVKNARDLASVDQSPVQPGRLFRTGRMGEASEHDIEVLFQQMNITTVVDLRSPTELKDDENLMKDEVFGNFTNMLWRERRGCVTALAPGQSPIKRRFWNRLKGQQQSQNDVNAAEDDASLELEDDDEMVVDIESCYPLEEIKPVQGRKERHFVSVMNELKYVKGTVSKVRKRDLTKSLLKSPGALVSRRVRNSVKKPFLDEINGGGLPMVNDMLLRYGAPGIKYVLELCSDRRRHPVAFYCTAGKDRTGVITALILRLCGVPKEAIVEDYTLSANVYAEMNDHQAMVGALSQRSLDPKTFLGAPAYVMEDTLDAMEDEYGSVEGYLNSIGFGPEKQQRLKDACLMN